MNCRRGSVKKLQEQWMWEGAKTRHLHSINCGASLSAHAGETERTRGLQALQVAVFMPSLTRTLLPAYFWKTAIRERYGRGSQPSRRLNTGTRRLSISICHKPNVFRCNPRPFNHQAGTPA